MTLCLVVTSTSRMNPIGQQCIPCSVASVQREYSELIILPIFGEGDKGRTRDVNFVFFQKSIIVLKKSILFRLSNLGVAISSRYAAGYCVTCRAPPGSAST